MGAGPKVSPIHYVRAPNATLFGDTGRAVSRGKIPRFRGKNGNGDLTFVRAESRESSPIRRRLPRDPLRKLRLRYRSFFSVLRRAGEFE